MIKLLSKLLKGDRNFDVETKQTRESLKSRLGFILLSAGCAIGLGNVWRFPYITGKYGGAAFVLLYIFFLITLGLPIMVMEFSVGRAAQGSIITAFKKLEPQGSSWHVFGKIMMAGNYLLLMYYTVITGWMLAYCWYFLTGKMSGLTPEQIGGVFNGLLANPWELTFWLVATVVLCTAICYIGLQKGVERITKVMMLGLLFIMMVLALRSVTLTGAEKGLEFYLMPQLANLTKHGLWTSISAAMGQAFFTLSVGMGGMAIFGSYIGKEKALTGESIVVIILDTFVALTAGLIIFPSCFAYGVDVGSGPGLIFVSLPNTFNNMVLGRAFGTFFFVFMSFAALSTVIAVFENIIANSMESVGWTRKKASLINMVTIIVLALPCVLGFNEWSAFAPLGKGSMVLDLEDFLVSNNIMPLGAVVFALFCTRRYGWGWEKFFNEANTGEGVKIPACLRWYMAYVPIIIVLFLFVYGYYEKFLM